MDTPNFPLGIITIHANSSGQCAFFHIFYFTIHTNPVEQRFLSENFKKTKAQRGKVTYQSHTCSEEQTWDPGISALFRIPCFRVPPPLPPGPKGALSANKGASVQGQEEGAPVWFLAFLRRGMSGPSLRGGHGCPPQWVIPPWPLPLYQAGPSPCAGAHEPHSCPAPWQGGAGAGLTITLAPREAPAPQPPTETPGHQLSPLVVPTPPQQLCPVACSLG